MPKAVQFDYGDSTAPSLSCQLPYLPISLRLGSLTLNGLGLLDTGASVNGLPYDIGLRLGAVWEQENKFLPLGGNFSRSPAKVIFIETTVAHFPPATLSFAWTQLNSVPIILGQMNFFQEFDVCFFGSQSKFEVRPKG